MRVSVFLSNLQKSQANFSLPLRFDTESGKLMKNPSYKSKLKFARLI